VNGSVSEYGSFICAVEELTAEPVENLNAFPTSAEFFRVPSEKGLVIGGLPVAIKAATDGRPNAGSTKRF
jgi:hypothetical protein